MAAGMELATVQQLKRGQGETNDRLDRLAAAVQAQAKATEALAKEQARTNQLLEWLGSLLAQGAPTG